MANARDIYEHEIRATTVSIDLPSFGHGRRQTSRLLQKSFLESPSVIEIKMDPKV